MKPFIFRSFFVFLTFISLTVTASPSQPSRLLKLKPIIRDVFVGVIAGVAVESVVTNISTAKTSSQLAKYFELANQHFMLLSQCDTENLSKMYSNLIFYKNEFHDKSTVMFDITETCKNKQRIKYTSAIRQESIVIKKLPSDQSITIITYLINFRHSKSDGSIKLGNGEFKLLIDESASKSLIIGEENNITIP